MKIYRILSNPYALIICFSLILISGEHWGGFYGMYILMGLMFGGVHSFLAVAGILVIAAGHNWLKGPVFLQQLIKLVGVSLLFFSLYIFFTNDKEHYNWGTFEQTVPIITIIITSIVAICFLTGGLITKTNRNIETVS